MINIENLKEFLGSDEEFIATLIDKFLQEIPKETEKLNSAAKRADWPAVRATSHKMLSSTKIFNVDELTTLLQQIEKISESGTGTGRLPALISEFEVAGKKILEEIKQQREQLGK